MGRNQGDNVMSLKDIRNLDYVVLLCRDLTASRRFYEEVLGFPLEHVADTWISFRVGATAPCSSAIRKTI